MSEITNINEPSKEILEYFNCILLHEKNPIWNGDYIWNESQEKFVKNIQWICKECNKNKV